MTTSSTEIILVLIASLIGAFGALLLKKGSARLSRTFWKNINNYPVYLGIILYFVSSIFFIIALKRGELSVLYPIVATSYVWVTLLSIKFLKENIKTIQWIGIFLVIMGVILISSEV